jgi:hypothetical protein
MSIENGLYNRVLKSGVGISGISTNLIYFNVPWYPQSYVDQISLGNLSGVDSTVSAIVLIDSGAHYRFNTTDMKSHVIYRDTTDKALSTAEGMLVNWTFNPGLYVDNLYNRPYLSVAIIFSASQVIKPFLTVVGRKANSNTYIKSDSTRITALNDYRVLIGKNQTGTGGTAGTIFDVTSLALGNGGENKSQFSFSSTNDYVYIGSKKQIDHWDFQIGTGATWISTLTGQYWNTAGSGWSTFTAIDDTSSGNSDTMRYSGMIEASGIGLSTTWGPVIFRPSDNTQLPADPLTVLTDSIVAGTTPPIYAPENSPRHWVRFKMNTVPIPLLLNKILPVEEVYDPTF